MKVLWLCNIMLPAIAKELGLKYSNREGWLSGVFAQFDYVEENGYEVAVCFPCSDSDTQKVVKSKAKKEKLAFKSSNVSKFMFGKKSCYAFREDISTPEVYDPLLEEQMREILADFAPDIIHIFGSEFPHALALSRVCEKPDRILLGIQGLCGKIAEVYTDGIPEEVVNGETFRDIVTGDSILQQKEKFIKRSAYERELFSIVGHIAGRTAFDREVSRELNEKAIYHQLNENMRDSFYRGGWDPDKCEPHSIFLSQGDYPIKGFHYLLEAMPKVLYHFPEAQVYVAGNDIIGEHSSYGSIQKMQRKVKISSYGKYLKDLIYQNQLDDKVTMLGMLDENAMRERFLQSSVVVCPSLVENSPNAVCEAMLLGVPVVAAAVGGIPSLIRDGKSGLLYEPGNISDLSAAIRISWDKDLARDISSEATRQANKTHNRALNYMRILGIYQEIVNTKAFRVV